MDHGQILNCSNHWGAIVALLWFLHSIFEWWIGKTDKVKSSSTWQLLFSVILMGVTLILRRNENAKSTSNDGSSEGR